MKKVGKPSGAKRRERPSDVKDLPVKNASSVKGGAGVPVGDTTAARRPGHPTYGN